MSKLNASGMYVGRKDRYNLRGTCLGAGSLNPLLSMYWNKRSTLHIPLVLRIHLRSAAATLINKTDPNFLIVIATCKKIEYMKRKTEKKSVIDITLQ